MPLDLQMALYTIPRICISHPRHLNCQFWKLYLVNFMKVIVIFGNFQLFNDIDNTNLIFFGFVDSIVCIMNSSLCTKIMKLKTHYKAVKYKLNALSFSTNISNARQLRHNNGPCCNLYSLQWLMLSHALS